MTVMTLMSRILGLVREQVRAHFLGTSMASDAFGVAVMIPNLLRRLVAEGAMTQAFVPVLAEYVRADRPEELRRFLSRFLSFLTGVVCLIAVLGVLITPWLIRTFYGQGFGGDAGKVELTIALTQVMWPYLVFVTLAALIQGVLNTYKIFGPSAFTPVLLNLCIIGLGIGLAPFVPDPSYALVTGFVVGGVVQIAFQIPYLLRWTSVRFGYVLRCWGPGVRRVLLIMAPGVFAAGIHQINVFVSQVIAAGLEGGAIASLQYGIRLQELVLGLFVVSVAQVILPTLSEKTADNDHQGVRDTLSYASGLMAFVTFPATLGLILLGAPIIRLLFQFGAFDATSTERTAFALVFYALGLYPIAMSRVQSTVFYAHKDLRTPTIVALFVAAINIAGCLVLSVPLSHGGIALAGSLAALFHATAFALLLSRRLGPSASPRAAPPAWRRLARMALATALMSGSLSGLDQLWPHAAIESRLLLGLWILVACSLGAAVYLVACRLLGVDELKEVWAAARRKLRR